MNRVPTVLYRFSMVSLLVSLVVGANAASPPAVDLNPSAGDEIGMLFEAFLSPYQEPGEESETPKNVSEEFKSTTPSQTRAERVAAGHRGHGKVRFSKDFSRAFVDVRIEGTDISTINMFHIHCGVPGILGPILIDFSLATDLQDNFGEDRLFSVEITDELIVETAESGEGGMGAVTMGCLSHSASLGGLKPSKVSTVAGMAHIALQGELYFNLHTTGQTYFGDIRGQIHQLD